MSKFLKKHYIAAPGPTPVPHDVLLKGAKERARLTKEKSGQAPQDEIAEALKKKFGQKPQKD